MLDYFYSHPKQAVSFPDKDTMTWPSIEVAQEYNVYRKDLGFVDIDEDGVADDGYGDCYSGFDPDTTDTMFVDTDTPTAGNGFAYHMTYVNDVHNTEGGIGKASLGQQRPNFSPCP